MIVLGIESTAHTFGISILKDKKFLCNLRDMYTTKKGGIILDDATKHHRKVANSLYEKALKQSKIKENQINVIAYSNAPGLAPCLIAGRDFAKKLALKLKVPLVPVNHCIAHLEIGEITRAKDAVLLYCSGANTQVIAYASGKYRVFGETLDIGVGNFIDAFARTAGLGFPAGPKIGELAKKSKKFIELPYNVKGMDVAFSGLLTNLKQRLGKYELEDLSFSLQETAFAMLIEVAERAMAHLNKKELLLGGGVACNKRLQQMAKIMCKERKAKFFVPEKEFLVDNAGMIAWLGKKMFKKGIKINPKRSDIDPRQRTDDVNVTWK
ncbi:MAG: tRNA (adenosine(37)-N6)-threonylcarbamoyltransferase complex transferase subunit TsaD [archaeon]|nr:MAG: tRNA (adenosine(37)-N6)-threonylcarbamoyltransferase complex transferase subunit TsaD [archaeon]